MDINESLKRTIQNIDAFMNDETLGRIVVENETTALLCEVDSNDILFEIADHHGIRIINGSEYMPYTKHDILTIKDDYGCLLLAGQRALVK